MKRYDGLRRHFSALVVHPTPDRQRVYNVSKQLYHLKRILVKRRSRINDLSHVVSLMASLLIIPPPDVSPSLQTECNSGHADIIEILITKGNSDVNIKDDYEWTALHHAAMHDHVEATQLLLHFMSTQSSSQTTTLLHSTTSIKFPPSLAAI
jgi:ankyrin repeat protein